MESAFREIAEQLFTKWPFGEWTTVDRVERAIRLAVEAGSRVTGGRFLNWEFDVLLELRALLKKEAKS